MIFIIFLALLASISHTNSAPKKSPNYVRDFSKLSSSSSGQKALDDLTDGWKPTIIRVVTTHCSECKSTTPLFRDVAAKLNGKVNFVDLDYDDYKDLLKSYIIRRLPAFMFAGYGRLDTYKIDLNLLTRETLTNGIKKHFRITT
jgi:thiol-disulfide isomerase/thioredoxin